MARIDTGKLRKWAEGGAGGVKSNVALDVDKLRKWAETEPRTHKYGVPNAAADAGLLEAQRLSLKNRKIMQSDKFKAAEKGVPMPAFTQEKLDEAQRGLLEAREDLFSKQEELLGLPPTYASMYGIGEDEMARRRRELLGGIEASRPAHEGARKTFDVQRRAARGGGSPGFDPFALGLSGLAKAAFSIPAFIEEKLIGAVAGEENARNVPGFFRGLYEMASLDTSALAERVDQNKEKYGQAYSVYADIAQALGSAAPQAALALLSVWTAAAAPLLEAATAAPGLAGTIMAALRQYAKEPLFRAAAAVEAGAAFDEARQRGADDVEALSTALITGTINGLIEVTGGLEALPAAIRKGGKRLVREWVESSLHEGKEEVVQGVVGRLASKAAYSPKTPLFSVSDASAPFNPAVMATEGALGAAAGGVLGGAQIGASALLSGLIEPQQGKTEGALEGREKAGGVPEQKAREYGKAGARALAEIEQGRSDAGQAPQEARAAMRPRVSETEKNAFDVYYRAGREMIPITALVESAEELTPVMSKAYEAGLEDAKAQIRLENETMKAVIEGTAEPGFYANRHSEAAGVSGEAAGALDALARAAGVRITFVGATGETGYNGFYDGKAGTVYIASDARDPFFAVAKHEITHALAKAAPEEFGAYRDYVARVLGGEELERSARLIRRLYKEHVGQELSEEEAIEEVVANFTGELLISPGRIERLARERRSVAERLLEALRSLVRRLKAAIAGRGGERSDGIELRRLETAEKLWVRALEKAGEGARLAPGAEAAEESREAGRKGGSGKYSLKRAALTDDEIRANIAAVAEMEEVAELTGDEFPKGDTSLLDQVYEFFGRYGYAVENPDIGRVELTRRGIKSSIYHGLGKKKIAAFAAVPEVIMRGKIIDAQENWKGRGYDTAVIAAPININRERHYVAAVVVMETERRKYYLHEVLLANERRTDEPFSTGTARESGAPGGASSPSILSLLRKVADVKDVRYSLKGFSKEKDGILNEIMVLSRLLASPPFYSRLERTVQDSRAETFGADSLIPFLKKRGVSDDEIRWLGVREFLEGKKSVGKAELLEYLRASDLKIEEAYYISGGEEGPPRYREYSLPGGENYRELLFVLPDKYGEFRTAHWERRNVLAHARVQDFRDTAGRAVLFVEEVQSDWHQQGREKGYGIRREELIELEALERELDEAVDEAVRSGENELNGRGPSAAEEAKADWRRRNPEKAARIDELRRLYRESGLPPEAPLSGTWHEYVLKRLIRMAAEDGYDKMAWAPGQIQAERYGLDRPVETLIVLGREDGKYELRGYDADNRRVMQRVAAPEALERRVGAALAARILRGESEEDVEFAAAGGYLSRQVFRGVGLDPASGLREFYDVGGKSSQNIPRFLEKYVRQWGSSIGETVLENLVVVPSVEITHEMWRSVMFEGQPRFSLKASSELSADLARLRERNELLRRRFESQGRAGAPSASAGQFARELTARYGGEYGPDALPPDELSAELEGLLEDMAGGEAGAWEELKRRAAAIARRVVESASSPDEDLKRDYLELIRFTRGWRISVSEEEKRELGEDYGGFDKFRRRNFGRFTISGDGAGARDFYAALCEKFPQYFAEDAPEGSSGAPLLKRVADTLDAIRAAARANPYEGMIEAAVEYVACDIVEWYLGGAPESGAGGKAPAEKAQIRRVREQAEERVREVLRREAQRRLALAKKMAERFKAREEGAKERQKKSALRWKIRRAADDLSRMLTRPTEESHIPVGFVKPVADLLKEIDLKSGRMGEKTKARLDELRAIYQRISDGKSDMYMPFDPEIMDNIEELGDISGERVAEMPLYKLELLHTVLKAVRQSVWNFNRSFRDAGRRTIAELAEGVMRENSTIKPYVESAYPSVRALKDLVGMDSLSPGEFFTLSGETMRDLYCALRRGLDVKLQKIQQAQDYLRKATEGLEYRRWTGKRAEKKTFKLDSGEEIALTPAQVMSLYRLHLQEQARGHIYAGGIRPAPIITRGKSGVLKITKSFEPVKVTPADVSRIVGSLTEEQRRVADAVGKFFVEVTAKWGNLVSAELYGYEKFTEENYFPIVSDENFLITPIGERLDMTLEHMGITKPRVKGASNPVIVEDIFDVFTRQADKMSSYLAFVPPLADIKRVFNYKSGNGSVKLALERKHGRRAIEYIKNFLVAVNGDIRREPGSELFEALLKRYKVATLALNMRVVLQQPTSYVRAAAEIDLSYLARGALMRGNWEEVRRYSPLATWLDMGYYALDVGRQMKDVFLNEPSAAEAVMAGISAADRMAWSRLWNAVKLEVADTRPELKPYAQDYYRAVAERFEEIIDKTQVVDTIFHRSQIMRSRSMFARTITSFMAEPTRQFNMLYLAARQLAEKNTPEARKRLARVAASVVASMFANAVVVSVVDAWRDEKKDEPFYIRAFNHLFGLDGNVLRGNFLEQMTGMLPLFDEVFDMLAYGEPRKNLYAEGLYSFTQGLYELTKLLYDVACGQQPQATLNLALRKFAEGTGALFGMPVKNVLREIETAVDNGFEAAGANMAEYGKLKAFHNIRSSSGSVRAMFYDALFKASIYGERPDKKAFEVIMNDMLKNGYTEEQMEEAIKDRIRRKDEVQADKEKYEKEIVGKLEADPTFKKFGEEYKKRALDSARALAGALALEKHSEFDLYDKRKAASSALVEKLPEFLRSRVASKRDEPAVTWMYRADQAKEEGGVDYYKYILFMTARAEARGEDDSLKQDEVVDILEKMRLTDRERSYLFSMAYPDSKNNPF